MMKPLFSLIKIEDFDFKLSKNEVHVWSVNAENFKNINKSYWQILSQDESDRVIRFHFEKDQNVYICARTTLRILLGNYLSIKPSQIIFDYSEFGKPSISKNQNTLSLNFNISHTENLIVLAFTLNDVIGIDIELLLPNSQFLQIAQRYFSENEYQKLRSTNSELQTETFYSCWTRKEAFIKAVGNGLSYPLSDFEISISPKDEPKLLQVKDENEEINKWDLRKIVPAKNYIGAVAVRGRINNLKCVHINSTEIK